MHEVSVCRDLVAMVEATALDNGAVSVKSVNLRLGPFSHVQASALAFCFSAVAQGTLAEGAQLHIEHTAGEGRCPKCQNRQVVQQRFVSCVRCDYFPLEVEGAEELVLQSIEVN